MYYYKHINKSERYFREQLSKPKESTKEFFNILKKLKLNNFNTLDLACGNGANLMYLKKKFDNKKYCLGLDFNKLILNSAKQFNAYENLDLKYGNILNLKDSYVNKFQLITSFQTLSWLEDYEKASIQMIKLKPKYIGLSSLFWKGLIDFKIKLNFLKNNSYQRNLKYFNYYNIYSLNNFLDFFKVNKYESIYCKKFEIKKELPNNFKQNMGTYTMKSKKKNIQISGPLIMNWYFIIFKRK